MGYMPHHHEQDLDLEISLWASAFLPQLREWIHVFWEWTAVIPNLIDFCCDICCFRHALVSWRPWLVVRPHVVLCQCEILPFTKIQMSVTQGVENCCTAIAWTSIEQWDWFFTDVTNIRIVPEELLGYSDVFSLVICSSGTNKKELLV